jgi:hypothetical protein
MSPWRLRCFGASSWPLSGGKTIRKGDECMGGTGVRFRPSPLPRTRTVEIESVSILTEQPPE